MRSKAPLAVIEQLVMLLVFGLAAAICLWGFAWADSTSRHNQNCDLAMVQAQNVAALIQWSHGDLVVAAERMGGQAEKTQWIIYFDEQWAQTETVGAFCLQVRVEPFRPLMGTARITVSHEQEPLAELTVCWQEVAADER